MTEVLPTKNKPDTQASHVPTSTEGGQKSVTSKFAKETAAILDALATLKDAMNTYPFRMEDGKMAEPHISSDLMLVVFPITNRHVIRNVVTSDGKLDFEVDGQRIIPVTSEEE